MPGVPIRRGVGDYLEPGAQRVLPGSYRRPNPVVTEAPGGVGVEAASPAQAAAFVAALEQIIAKYGGLPVRERPFRFWQANAYVLTAVAPTHMDVPILRNRRGVILINSDAANTVWYGPTAAVRVNNGAFLGAGAPASWPFDENAQFWAIATAGAPVVSIVQVAD